MPDPTFTTKALSYSFLRKDTNKPRIFYFKKLILKLPINVPICLFKQLSLSLSANQFAKEIIIDQKQAKSPAKQIIL